ncbi:6,7-dimethyl-8-ribityllumazine synthase [Roseomonas sp. SSH11]|uniref:6,7-dimethyl-8-ribityllumazine synthase n=1 Tax=Pararoseomonas baculiformis TaxID=2820812 RepID=A0ABS4AFH7_9PROT|nr:6,7-dimethyl-8-ribityllumazine synthase [Pararoseomonas baculiformis]MBP0445783.1 6,7-dimethyl-8-ribityllumazine synthase [Pararoseomonas baculiformis]
MSTADAPLRVPPELAGPPPRVAVIQAPYYADVVGGMVDGALAVLAGIGSEAEVLDVAGAFELPAALRLAIRSGRYDGYLLFGCVVKGETDHYDHICREACRGVMDISVETAAPIGFGLLTVHDIQQAIARSSPDRHNKGVEAANALIWQIALARRLEESA